jgi:two-component system, LytTR family, sensor kinase
MGTGLAVLVSTGFTGLVVVVLWLLKDRRRLHHRLADAEARRLRTQLNPHFLYNTLNAISELGYNDPKTADDVITQLSQLLRKSLDDSEQTEIALRAEVAFLERYLNIQKILLRERLDVALEVAADTLNARVPGMIIQPLAENALTHGVGGDGVARLSIKASRQDGDLIIDVEDWGPGLRQDPAGRGIGLSNIRARLLHLYEDTARLELLERSGGGLMARLVIPFHESYAYREAPRSDR